MEQLFNIDTVQTLSEFLPTRDLNTFRKGIANLHPLSEEIKEYVRSPEYWKMRVGRLLKFKLPADMHSTKWARLYRSLLSSVITSNIPVMGTILVNYSVKHKIPLFDWWMSKCGSTEVSSSDIFKMCQVEIAQSHPRTEILELLCKYIVKKSYLFRLIYNKGNQIKDPTIYTYLLEELQKPRTDRLVNYGKSFSSIVAWGTLEQYATYRTLTKEQFSSEPVMSVLLFQGSKEQLDYELAVNSNFIQKTAFNERELVKLYYRYPAVNRYYRNEDTVLKVVMDQMTDIPALIQLLIKRGFWYDCRKRRRALIVCLQNYKLEASVINNVIYPELKHDIASDREIFDVLYQNPDFDKSVLTFEMFRHSKFLIDLLKQKCISCTMCEAVNGLLTDISTEVFHCLLTREPELIFDDGLLLMLVSEHRYKRALSVLELRAIKSKLARKDKYLFRNLLSIVNTHKICQIKSRSKVSKARNDLREYLESQLKSKKFTRKGL